jgi:hypothetical protein
MAFSGRGIYARTSKSTFLAGKEASGLRGLGQKSEIRKGLTSRDLNAFVAPETAVKEVAGPDSAGLARGLIDLLFAPPVLCTLRG